MKRQVQAYTFSPGGAGAGTVTFTNLASVALDRVLLVLNATRGVIIYNPFDPALLGTVSTNVLTLATSTSGHSSGDKLVIFYEDTNPDLNSDGGGVDERQATGLLVPASGGAATVPGDGTNGLYVQPSGRTAAGSSLTVNPVTIGGRAGTSTPTAVSDGQVVNAWLSKHGKVITAGSPRDLKGIQQTPITSSTLETTIVTAAGSGIFADLYGLVLTNTSGTTTSVTIKDSTAGTTRFVFQVPPYSTTGFSVPVDSAALQNTANLNWTATCGTSVASIQVTALYVKTA